MEVSEEEYEREKQARNALLVSKHSALIVKAMEQHRKDEKQAKTGSLPDITRTIVEESSDKSRVIVFLYGSGGTNCGRYIFRKTGKGDKFILRADKPEQLYAPEPPEEPEPLDQEQIAIGQYLESVGFEKRTGKFLTHFSKGGGAEMKNTPDFHKFSHCMRIHVLHHLFYSQRMKHFSLVVRHDEAKGEAGGGFRRYTVMDVPRPIYSVAQAKYFVDFFTGIAKRKPLHLGL